MVETVITFGAILTAITALISIFLVKMTSKESHAGYYPNVFLALAGILLILVASIAPKVDFAGAGFGGIGIACMFAGAIGFIISAVMDSYKNVEA